LRPAVIYVRMATPATLTRKAIVCRQWAARQGFTVIGEFAEVAGGLAEHLPAFEDSLDQASQRGVVLICPNESTLGRDIRLQASRIERCRKQRVQLVFSRG
jgi:DNA invertase Pin-like site-specific DNA recombinase